MEIENVLYRNADLVNMKIVVVIDIAEFFGLVFFGQLLRLLVEVIV